MPTFQHSSVVAYNFDDSSRPQIHSIWTFDPMVAMLTPEEIKEEVSRGEWSVIVKVALIDQIETANIYYMLRGIAAHACC